MWWFCVTTSSFRHFEPWESEFDFEQIQMCPNVIVTPMVCSVVEIWESNQHDLHDPIETNSNWLCDLREHPSAGTDLVKFQRIQASGPNNVWDTKNSPAILRYEKSVPLSCYPEAQCYVLAVNGRKSLPLLLQPQLFCFTIPRRTIHFQLPLAS